MSASTGRWRNTTHDWARAVDVDHLARIRQGAAAFAPGGAAHLILEVAAYAAEEDASNPEVAGRCIITLHPDCSVSVSDNGRGTDTRFDEWGQPVRKPVMATKDVRFLDVPATHLLPDGHPRRGMSVVAALSQWLLHTNRRGNGAWTQRYEHGLPVADLVPIAGDGSTGTTVHFLPDDAVGTTADVSASKLRQWSAAWPQLAVEVNDERRQLA